MKNRVLLMAAIAALAGPQIAALNAPPGGTTVAPPPNVQGAAGTQLPQGGSSSILGSLLDSTGSYGYRGPTYQKRGGWTVAEAHRRKRKTRNRLRAKGQYRRAVR